MQNEDGVECPEHGEETVTAYHLLPRGKMMIHCTECGVITLYGWVTDSRSGSVDRDDHPSGGRKDENVPTEEFEKTEE